MHTHTATPRNRQENRAVLEALSRCVAACELCADACLEEDDLSMMVNCIRNCRDCSDICRLTATFIARGSDHARHVLRECLEVCQKCYNECSQHDDAHCKACAAACQACLEACRAYAG